MTGSLPRFSAAATRIAGEDAVVEILRLAERPGVISLAGGLPDPAVFQVEETRAAMERVLAEHASEALNYSPNPGVTALRELLAERMGEREGIPAHPDEILVVSGGVEGIRHALNGLCDPGDPLLVEDPTYLAALHIARELGLRPTPVASDSEGPIPEALDEVCDRLAGARLLYANPTFSNPTGRTWSRERRMRILEVCERRDVFVVEDHAYAELRYDGTPVPALKAIAPERVIFIHTFSKIFGPGLRLGWVAADPALVARFGLLKLGSDQCSGALVQRLAIAYAESGALDRQVRRSRALYRDKRDAMLGALEAGGSDSPLGLPSVRPEGGFFLWLDTAVDTEVLLPRAIEDHRVAFVAGAPFFADPESPPARTSLRLSFSHVPARDIPEAIRRLGASVGAAG